MIGERLRSARIGAHHTQESLAELMGTNARQIWRWENGHNEPDADKVARLAQNLSVSTDYLLGLTDDPTPQDRMRENLSREEKQLLAAYRRGDLKAALRVIIGGE